jgi:STE24 endopeptidase
MNTEQILILIIFIISFNFLLERFLSFLNVRNLTSELPPEASDIYSPEKYTQSQNYLKAKARFGIITSVFSFIMLMLMLITGGFAWVDSFAGGISEHYIVHSLVFFGILGLAFDIVSIPFDLYGTFVIEERFGFNKTKPLTFFTDKLKSWLLTIIIGGGIMSVIIFIWHMTGPWFVLIALSVVGAFGIFMSMFYTQLIVPLFNKLRPLPDGDLKNEIEAFGRKAGFPVSKISVIDSSKRSTKSNAYFSGLGRKKRIVLYDTLIEKHTTEELVAVLAHEIGHYKKKHVHTGLITGFLQTGGLLFLLYIFLGYPVFQEAIGAANSSFHMGVLVFGMVYSPFSLILGLLDNYISRRNEYAADAFAASYGLANALRDALKKLSADNLSNLTPHSLYVFFHYSHPPLLKRLKALSNTEV